MANLVDLPEEVKNAEHLNILRICHYVVGGMSILFSFFFLFHIIFGFFFVKESAGILMAAIGLFMMFMGWVYGGLVIWSGKSIAQRKNRSMIIAVSALNCFNCPLGLLLGVFTFIVMGRNSVKEEFEGHRLSAERSPKASLSAREMPLDLSKVPDPDEEMWLEMERNSKQAAGESLKVEDLQKES